MGHGQEYRDKIEKLVKECNHGGKLDLQELHARTVNLASDLTGKSYEYQYGGSSKEIQARKATILKDLTLATHEVLGLIKRDDWNHEHEGLFDKDPGRQNNFIPVKDGKIVKPVDLAHARLDVPLAKQGIDFVTTEYLAQQHHVGGTTKTTSPSKTTAPAKAPTQHPKVDIDYLNDKLSNDVRYLKDALSHVSDNKPIATKDKENMKELLDEVVKIDKQIRKAQNDGSNVYSREERNTLVDVINTLSKHKIGTSDKAFGEDIKYLQANGVHNANKDNSKGRQ